MCGFCKKKKMEQEREEYSFDQDVESNKSIFKSENVLDVQDEAPAELKTHISVEFNDNTPSIITISHISGKLAQTDGNTGDKAKVRYENDRISKTSRTDSDMNSLNDKKADMSLTSDEERMMNRSQGRFSSIKKFSKDLKDFAGDTHTRVINSISKRLSKANAREIENDLSHPVSTHKSIVEGEPEILKNSKKSSTPSAQGTPRQIMKFSNPSSVKSNAIMSQRYGSSPMLQSKGKQNSAVVSPSKDIDKKNKNILKGSPVNKSAKGDVVKKSTREIRQEKGTTDSVSQISRDILYIFHRPLLLNNIS